MREPLMVQTDRVYQIQRTVQGVVCLVNGKPLPLRLDLWNHSPTGFEFGYGGSGPAQLALAILADCCGEEVAMMYHQAFKWKVIAHIPDPGINLSGTFVSDVLAQLQLERAAANCRNN